MTRSAQHRSTRLASLVASALLLGPAVAAHAQVPAGPAEPTPPAPTPAPEPEPEPAPAPPPPAPDPTAYDPAPAPATPAPATPAPATPPVETANKGKLTIKGFVSATLFAQDTSFSFSDGQNAQFPVPTRSKGNDPWFIDGDVRNTRLNLTWDGPEGPGIPKLGAQLEVDFFAPAGGGGGFGNAQAVPRIRLAHADLGLGKTTLRIGQAWSPWFGNVPVSLSHIAFPLGWGAAGHGGWRFPGLFWIVPLTAKEAAVGMKLTVAVMRNSWAGAPALNPPNQGSSGLPQVQARLDVEGKAGTLAWTTYVVGHYDRKDLSDPAGRGDTLDESLDGYGAQIGAKLTAGPLLLQGNAYYGHAMGQHLMHITQFGDIEGFGAWAQVGYDLTPSWGVYGFYGVDNPKNDDVRAAVALTPETAAGALPRLRNQQMAAMVRYKVGPYQLGLEYLLDLLNYQDQMGVDDVTGSQISSSVQYAF
jgi:hypothetical protein